MAKANKSKALPNENTVTDDRHSILIQWVNDADESTIDSRKNSEKSRDYYDSNQWTDAEKAKLKKQKQAATVRNRIKPKVDGLLGMEQSNKTTAKALARTPKHAQAATACTEAVRFVLQDNAYEEVRSEAWENLLIEGTTAIEIISKNKNGQIKTTINHIHWDRLIYDPHRRRKNFSDAKYLGQHVWLDYEDAVRMYPNAKDVLESTISTSSTYDDKPKWMDGIRKRVRVVELYWKEAGTVKYAVFTRGGYCIEPTESIYINEEKEKVWPYEFASLFINRESGAYGAAFQLLDIQDEINKRGSKALHLMSVRQIKAERGAVEDVNKTRQQLAEPDGYVEVTPGMEFDILKTGDMAAAQFQLLAEAKQEIDAVSYNAAAAGKETRIMSGVALRNREAASQTELAPMFKVLRQLDIRVYRKIWMNIQQFWTEERWIRVTDDEQNLNWVGLNKPITKGEMLLKQAQEQGMPPEQLQQMQMQLQADPMSKEVVNTENELAALDMDIIMSDAPDTLTTQIEDFQVLGEMVKSGFQMPPLAVIEASPLSNKEKIMKMMKEQPQLSPEQQKKMEEMQQQMQQLQQESQKLSQENQQLKMGQQETQMKIQADSQAQSMKIQADREKTMADLQLKQEAQTAEIQLSRDKVTAEIQLEREKAQTDIQLKQMVHQDTTSMEIDSAMLKVQTLIQLHEQKMQSMMDQESKTEEKTEGTEEPAYQGMQMQAMHNEMMDSIAQIMNALNTKKVATFSDGRQVTIQGVQ